MVKFKTRTLCIGAAALLVGAAAVTGSPQSAPEVTASAVVNAPLVRIASPFDGKVDFAPPSRGTSVRPGDLLVRVKATPHGGQYLLDLKARLASTQRELSATSGQIKALSGARAELKTRMEIYRKGAIARLTAQLDEALALHNIYKARLSQSGDALDRQQQLKTKGYASQANFDAASASATVAKNDVAASAARIQRIRVELDSAKKGVFIGDNRDDVPYSQQRDDEIMLRLVDLNASAKNLQATAKELQGQIAAEARRVAADEVYQQAAVVTGVVWDTTGPKGTPVRAGDTLVNVLDCGRAFLEVNLDESQAKGIKPGDGARIRIAGDDHPIDGTVRALRGAVTRTDRDEHIAETEPQTPGQMTALVDIPAPAEGQPQDNFCHVGRVAEVTFGGTLAQHTASIAGRGETAPAPVARYAAQRPEKTARN
jgi:multidrug resistance efflux pump